MEASLPWCDVVRSSAATGADDGGEETDQAGAVADVGNRCDCYGLLRTRPGFWADRDAFVAQLSALYRNRLADVTFEAFAGGKLLLSGYVSHHDYLEAQLVEVRDTLSVWRGRSISSRT